MAMRRARFDKNILFTDEFFSERVDGQLPYGNERPLNGEKMSFQLVLLSYICKKKPCFVIIYYNNSFLIITL